MVEDGAEEEDEELGGMFKVSRPDTVKRHRADLPDCSRFSPDASRDWDLDEVRNPDTQQMQHGCYSINRYVTVDVWW